MSTQEKVKQSLSPLIKKQIVEKLIPLKSEKIILFGSYAYGTPTEDSDLDICVIRKDYENRWDDKAKIRQALSDIDMPKDILNPKIDEFEFYKNEINSVYYDADKKGELLWSS